MHAGVYLGHLWGRRPPRPPPPQKRPRFLPKYCYHYNIKVTILEESSRRDKVNSGEVGITCLRTRQGTRSRLKNKIKY